jgi:hypothetical protein
MSRWPQAWIELLGELPPFRLLTTGYSAIRASFLKFFQTVCGGFSPLLRKLRSMPQIS